MINEEVKCRGSPLSRDGGADLRKKGICIAFGDTVPDRKASAAGKPPLFTGAYLLLGVSAISQVHRRAGVVASSHSSHISANHASMQICACTRACAPSREYSLPHS